MTTRELLEKQEAELIAAYNATGDAAEAERLLEEIGVVQFGLCLLSMRGKPVAGAIQ